MGDITTIGLDLAKNVFQVHAVDQAGNVVVRKRIRRGQVLAFFSGIPTCLVGLEACATAHHWARELIALGHDARLMPPNYVKAYVKRNKHDVADAEAICEAVRRPSMRFVPLKTTEQQSALMMHRARDLLIRQRTMLVNALRGHLAEFGLIEAQGLHKVARLVTIVVDEVDERVPEMARQVLKVIVNQLKDIQTGIADLEKQVLVWHKNNPVSQRLATIPGIGPIIATAIAATIADPNTFRSGREFACAATGARLCRSRHFAQRSFWSRANNVRGILGCVGGALARRPHRPGTHLFAARVIELAQRGIHGGAKPFRGAVDGFRPHMD